MITKPLWGKLKSSFSDTEPASTLPMLPPGEESAYADTTPSPLVRLGEVRPAEFTAVPVPAVTLYDVMNEIRKDNRDCPQPHRWVEFYALLQSMADGAAMPSPPLVGSAWQTTNSLAKRMCFREQVEWASGHNCLNAAFVYLKSLPEEDWHYMG